MIGEEKCDEFKTYHFDYRGSTIAITDSYGYVIDTFKYDTYGNVTEHVGNSFVIFGYNGRDGVVTDNNGLIYMRARYYSPELKRFVNADIIPGQISDSITLNRYAYANGNPASYVDPFGLAVEDSRGGNSVYNRPSYRSLRNSLNKGITSSKNTSFVARYDISDSQYRQIIDSGLDRSLRPNQKGYGDITTLVNSDVQLFTTQKHIKKGFLQSEEFSSISYLFVTASVSEWRELIKIEDLYDEDSVEVVGTIIKGLAPLVDEYTQTQVGEFAATYYDDITDCIRDTFDLDNVVLDKFSRYISGKTSGLDGSEEISIFLGAFYWKHSENYFTGEWSTGALTYENPWDKQIVLIQD